MKHANLNPGDYISMTSENSNWDIDEFAKFVRWNPHNPPYAIIELRGDEYSAHPDDFVKFVPIK